MLSNSGGCVVVRARLFCMLTLNLIPVCCRVCQRALNEWAFPRWRDRIRRSGVCRNCTKTRDARYQTTFKARLALNPALRERYAQSSGRWAKENPEKAKAHGQMTWLRLRQEMLNAYGRACACCGETLEPFLTLEHVNGDGAIHRLRVGGGANSYRDLKKRGWPKKGFTVLCMNCNWAKRKTGVCPHQNKKKDV